MKPDFFPPAFRGPSLPAADSVERILAIKLRAIGDVVLSTIVIANLRAAFPGAAIHFLTEAMCGEVVSAHPELDEVVVLDRKAMAGLGPGGQLSANLAFLRRIRRARYDLVFDFFGNPRSALITRWSGARWRVGYDFRLRRLAYNVVVPSRANELHEAEWHLDALAHVGIATPFRHLAVIPGAAAEAAAADFWHTAGLAGRRVIALNFSGGWAAKRWPVDRFAELAGLLVSRHGVAILIIWGPGEQEQARQLAAAAPVPVTLIPAVGLTHLAALLARVDLMVSTDSGPMHIAAAMGTRCVGLFGPTNYRLQGPYGAGHRVVVNRALDCLGCNRTACSHVSCMQGLTTAAVLEEVEQALAELPRTLRSGRTI